MRPSNPRIHLTICLLAFLLCCSTASATSSRSAESWLTQYRTLIEQAPRDCPPAAIPAIPSGLPTQAFAFEHLGTPESANHPLVIYSFDSIAERLLVLAEDARGCVHTGLSGRAVAFDARGINSPLPNTLLPAALGPTPPVAIVADSKFIRPLVGSMPESNFRSHAVRTWIGLGAYTGVLSVLLLVGIGFALWQRSRLAIAYVAYLCALQVYQLQAFGLGFAALPFWPGPEHARLMQPLAVAGLVIGIVGVVITFTQPRGILRNVIIGLTAVSVLGFVISPWSVYGYRLGAAAVALLTMVVTGLLIGRLRGNEPAMRWFAGGLWASTLGGGFQALTAFEFGASLPGIASYGFLLGNLIESTCWIIALSLRFRADRLGMLRRLEYDANHDPLTGTSNRSALRQQIGEALAWVKARPEQCCGLLYIDLDDFKQTNDSLGQAVADQVLVATARALEALNLPSDCIGRFGGDEFLMLIRPGTHCSVTEGAAATVVARFKEPLRVEDRTVPVSASVGSVIVTDAYDDIDVILEDATMALSVAKHAGGGRMALFEPFMRRDVQQRAQLRTELGVALRKSQLALHYQPVFDLESMRPVGFEALLRWDHPERGLLRAADFLPLAERCGLLSRLSEVVIEQAFRQVNHWQRAGLWRHGEYLSINISPQQLADERLLEQLDGAFKRHLVDPGSIRIDLPDRALSKSPDLVRRILPRLLGRNLLIAVDDFGSGLSSLTLHAEFGLNMIKLDTQVVAGITHLERSQNMARIALRLADELGSLVSAEGIETIEQLACLQTLGYRYGQGQLLAAPMSANEVGVWLDQWRPEILLDGETEARATDPVLH